MCFPILKDRGVLREDENQFVSLKFVVSEKKRLTLQRSCEATLGLLSKGDGSGVGD